MSMKNSNDNIGNRTRDLRLVAQCLNQLLHLVPCLSSHPSKFFNNDGTFENVKEPIRVRHLQVNNVVSYYHENKI
jgi:hypothetical protein